MERATKSFFRSISAEKRAELKKLHKIKPIYNLIPFLHILIWCITAIVMYFFPHWPILVTGYVIIGLIIHGFGALMHEAGHGNITRNRKIDKWISFIAGIVALVISATFTISHRGHHQHLGTKDDPDEFTRITKHPLLLRLLYFFWLFLGAPTAILFHFPSSGWRLASKEERGQILLEAGIALFVYSTILVIAHINGALNGLLHYWGLPWIVAAIFTNIRGWAEHGFTKRGNDLTETRTVISNSLVSFLSFNANYHREHHLFPAVPWYNLPKVYRLLRSEFESEAAFTHPSYLAFLVQATITLIINPHGLVRKPNKLRLQKFLPMIVVFLLSSVPLAGQSVNTKDSLLIRGDSAYAAFDNLTALSAYEEIYETGERTNTVLEKLILASYGYGTDLIAENLRQEAEAYIRKSAFYAEELSSRYPASVSTYFFLAITHGYVAQFEDNKGKIKIAVLVDNYCRRAIDLDPNFPHIYITYSIFKRAIADLNWLERTAAKLLFKEQPQGTYEEALALLKKAEELNPASSRVHYELAVTLIRVGLEEDARFHLEESLRLLPETTEDLRNQNTARDLLAKWQS